MRDGTETRERIERTALTLFVRHGVAGTSIRDIARGAGVSQGAMYNHYPSKDELAWRLFAANFSQMGTELRRAAREEATLEDKLRAMIGYVFERFDRDWVLVSYVFLARHMHLKNVTGELGNPYLAFRSVISREIRMNTIPAQDPDLAASLVTGAIIQVIDTKILGYLKGNLARRTGDVAAACVAMLQR